MVMQTLNYLLKKAGTYANEKFEAGIDIQQLKWTTIRHTAFRLTLEDLPELDAPKKLRDFAANGHTSEKMLLERYLNPLKREQQARAAREKIKPGKHTGSFFAEIMGAPESEEQRKKILALTTLEKQAAVREANRILSIKAKREAEEKVSLIKHLKATNDTNKLSAFTSKYRPPVTQKTQKTLRDRP